MDVCHHVIDAIRSRRGFIFALIRGDRAHEGVSFAQWWEEADKIAMAIEAAQKFDCTSLFPLFTASLAAAAGSVVEELGFNLPFPLVALTFHNIPVRNTLDGVEANSSMIYICHEQESGGVIVQTCQYRDGFWAAMPSVTVLETTQIGARVINWRNRALFPHYQINSEQKDSLLDAGLRTIMTLTAIESRDAERQPVPAPPKLNKARTKRGVCPLFDHTVVAIKLGREDALRAELGGTHASPRLHWRRGHRRVIASDREVWVKPHLVGDAGRGSVWHDYRVDF